MTAGDSTETGELGMNHVRPDGLLAVTQCERPIRYRDQQIIMQDTCTPEPRLDLIIQRYGGMYNTAASLDVAQITHMRDALTQWLADHKPPRLGWMHDGVTYDLDAAWWGRPDTPYHGMLFRHTGEWIDGVPMMKVTPDNPEYQETVPLSQVVGR